MGPKPGVRVAGIGGSAGTGERDRLGVGDRAEAGKGVTGTGRAVGTGLGRDAGYHPACGDRGWDGPWLQGWSMTPHPCPQVRRAIQQMLFQGKDFSWIRHVTIAVVLLTFINLLVIFAPSILGIFGLIGAWQHPAPVPLQAPGVVGSMPAPAPAWCWALPDPPCLSFPFSPCRDQVMCGGS